ncbi:MAG: hypothetical protein EOO20_18420 [Chryseobacterium sp.]|nr:MAG: hypothetical protein EOO20_18420 [Chryseobacterium sp.]
MDKHEFSPEGLSELLRQLYQLPDPQLRQEAAAVSADFRGWLKSNFNLAESQIIFLDALSNEFIAMAVIKSGYFIQNRLPIVLIKATTAGARSETQDKVVVVHQDTKGKYSEKEGFNEEQALSFTIEYQ